MLFFACSCPAPAGQIADLLTVQLGAADSDRGMLRCLYVVKALAESDIIGIADCLRAMAPTLQELTQDSNSGIREKSLLVRDYLPPSLFPPSPPQKKEQQQNPLFLATPLPARLCGD